MNLKAIIGMEVHVELNTKSKMFCGCPARHFRVKPNTHTCPVCLGLPGALPVPNKKAVDWTILIGLSLNCKINLLSKFDRKHYFYPDLAKGYQISQYDRPFCQNGFLILDSGKKIRINRVHLEEDTGKLIHKTLKGKKVSLIDFNRSGVPLVEIVTEPDFSSGSEAKEYLKKLRDIIKALRVSDCDMDKGSMRLEANISLRPDQDKIKLAGYKVEVKNLNSFRFVDQAINYELERQRALLRQGTTPRQETRGFDPKRKQTYCQRIKETAEDYRYFPEPDIPPIVLTQPQIDKLRTQLPQLPEQIVAALGLPVNTGRLLVAKPSYLDYYQQSLATAKKLGFTPLKLANLIINKKINLRQPAVKQLTALTQKQTLDPRLITQVISDNPQVVAKFKQGKTSVIGFLVGQVMKLTAGQADPNQARQLLLKNLS